MSGVFSKEICFHVSGKGSADGKLQSQKIKKKKPVQSSLLWCFFSPYDSKAEGNSSFNAYSISFIVDLFSSIDEF